MTRPAGHSTFFAGLRLALTMFTVAPIRVSRVDRRAGGVAMSVAPAIGVALGAIIGCLGTLTGMIGSTPLLASAVVVVFGALLTRGLHLDGLADTTDALGSYRGRDEALDVMKRSDIGPFGVAAIVLALLVQVAALTTIMARQPIASIAGVAVAAASGRTAVALACRRGIPAARETGLGALVSGTVAAPTTVVAAFGVAVLAVAAVPARPWQGPLAVLVALGLSLLLTRHAVRRFGGVTGDVLGATIEVTTTVTLLGLAIAG